MDQLLFVAGFMRHQVSVNVFSLQDVQCSADVRMPMARNRLYKHVRCTIPNDEGFGGFHTVTSRARWCQCQQPFSSVGLPPMFAARV
jgi:hypothetical protein